MSRKPAVGRSARPSSASVALRPEEAPLLPEMPAFFPDPVALDAEDRHLVVLRDALFQREYERSAKALLSHVQTQIEKGKKQEGRRRGSEVNSASRSASAETQEREATRTVLSPLPPEPLSEATPEHLINSEKNDLTLSGRNSSFSNSKGLKKSGVTEETVENPRIVSMTGASIASVLFPNGDNEVGQDVTSKKEKTVPGGASDENEFKVEGNQDQQQYRSGTPLTTPELPIYLTQPMPPSLITLAEEVGMANASLETCEVVMNILKAQDQHGGSIIPLLYPVQSAETAPETRKTLETGSANAPSTFSSNSQRGRQSIAIPPIRYVSTFPLIGALVLEAEQQVAVEMFCEDICEEIVSLAAEMYVSRCFDALATSYTAFSVWDELHDNVVRSFVPRDPGIPRSLEAELNSALAIRQGKNNKSNTENVVNAKNAITQTKSSVNGSAPYFGMLPIWTSTPSLLSADAILSFHQKATVPPKVFSGKVIEDGTSRVIRSDREIEKPKNTVVHRSQSSTFSRLLATSLHGGEKRQAINGVIVTDFSPSGKSKEVWRATGFTIEEDENSPGAPPDSIPLDDYARYVIPKSEDILKKKKEEEEEKKNQEEEGTGRRKVQRRRVSHKSQTTLSIHNSNYRKEGEGETQHSVSPHGGAQTSSGINTDYSASQHSKGSKRRGKQIQQDFSDGVSLSIGGSISTRPVSPEFMGDDNWTKALRHLPRGYLSMVGNSSNTTSGRNQTMETLVLIEGGNAVTVNSNVKKQRITSADNDSTKDSKKSRSRGKSLSPTTRGSIRSDEQKTTLQVSINNAGTVSFNTVRRSLTISTGTPNRSNTSPRNEKNNQQKQQQTQSQKQDSPKRIGKTRGDGYTFLSRKEQRRLEERMRRQKEAAEQAAYESMFFTASQPIVSTSVETAENAGGSPDAQKPPQTAKIVPEPGVLVEQLSSTSPARNTKTGVAINSKSRYQRGKEVEPTNQQTHSGAVVADGGEWILPEGKYRWSSFDPTNREKTAVTATAAAASAAAAAAVSRPTLSLSTERQSISQQKNTGETEDKKDEGSSIQNKESQSVNTTPSRMFPKPVVRPIRRAPPMIISAKKEEERLKHEHEKQKGGADKEMHEKGKTVNMKRHRSAKNTPMRVTLPRLPSQFHHSSSDDEIPSNRRNVKTPSAVEENKIRLLASILQNGRGMMD